MSRLFSRQRGIACVLSGMWLLLSGCGGPKILQVTGQVRFQGKPAPNLTVKFLPEEGRLSWGITDETGHYQLHYDRQHMGALRGDHKVYFSFQPRSPRPEAATPSADVRAVLAKYGDEKTTPLRYAVNKDGQVIDIDLD